MNERNICSGCFRTLREIMLWPGEDEAGRMKILVAAESRKKEAAKKT